MSHKTAGTPSCCIIVEVLNQLVCVFYKQGQKRKNVYKKERQEKLASQNAAVKTVRAIVD